MKIQVTFKTPDALDAALTEAFGIEGERELTDKEQDDREKLENLYRKFTKWGEYVDIEFDTEAGTAKVLPQ